MQQTSLPLKKPPGEVDRLSRAPSFCSHRQSFWCRCVKWCWSMGWICKAYTTRIQLTKEQSSHKSFFSVGTCVTKLSAFHNNAYNSCEKCHHELGHVSSLPVTIHSYVGERSQRLGDSKVILFAPLGLVSWKPLACGRSTEKQLSKEAWGSSAGVAGAVCITWPLHYTSWAEILVRGQPVCLLVFLIFHHKLYSAREDSHANS